MNMQSVMINYKIKRLGITKYIEFMKKAKTINSGMCPNDYRRVANCTHCDECVFMQSKDFKWKDDEED